MYELDEILSIWFRGKLLKKLLDGESLIKSYTIYIIWYMNSTILNSSQRTAIKTMYLSQD